MLTAYPVAGKAKSYEICEAFVQGYKGVGQIIRSGTRLNDGAAFFYGVDQSNIHFWEQVRSDPKREWYYCDNAYFDSTRQVYFRVTKNRLQHTGIGPSTGERFRALGLRIEPWTKSGAHIIVCPQSDPFMRDIAGFNGSWCDETVKALSTLTEREIRIRSWNRDKTTLSKTLAADLVNAYALVTWSSAAAITAVLSGVPVVTSSQCAAMPMSGDLFKLHLLPRKERAIWAGVLADNQWTLEEFRNGTTWRSLSGEQSAGT